LIERGHTLEDIIKKYTMDQVWLFYEKAQEIEKIRVKEFAVATRIAFGSNAKEWHNFMDKLSTPTPKKLVTREQLKALKGFGSRRR